MTENEIHASIKKGQFMAWEAESAAEVLNTTFPQNFSENIEYHHIACCVATQHCISKYPQWPEFLKLNYSI